jgi:hypothetical protein
MSAQQEAASDKRSILNRQLESADKATERSAQEVQQEAQRYGQDARMQGLEQAEQKIYGQTQADLTGAGGASIATAADNANVSEDYLKTKAARVIGETTRLTDVAREAAKHRAPGQLGMDDSLSLAGMSGRLGSMWGSTRNVARANSLDADSVEAPAYGALGQIATAAGGAAAANGMRAQGAGVMPPNPYATGPYASRPAGGINFGAR